MTSAHVVADIGPTGKGTLHVAGHDLTNHSRGFTVQAEVGELTRITLDLVGGTHLTLDGALQLDTWLTDLLLALGWTPPRGAA